MLPINSKKIERMDIIDWLKGWAIVAVVLDHLKLVPEPYVIWSVNIFVLVTAAMFAGHGYIFTPQKLRTKLALLFFYCILAILFFDLLYTFVAPTQNRPVLSLLLNPYSLLVENVYLGNIWYFTLHLQIVILAFFYLKWERHPQLPVIYSAAFGVSMISFCITHYFLHHFHTILVASWLLYLAVGFYALIPFLHRIENTNRHRAGHAAAAFALLLLIYVFYPKVPWAFTNENRSLFLTLPLYTVLIYFLGQMFYILQGSFLARRGREIIIVIGRYTLAIYLTHNAFALTLSRFFHSRWILAFWVVLASIVFGMIADRLFSLLKKSFEKINPSGFSRSLPTPKA